MSFRQDFAGIIKDVILEHAESDITVVKRALRAKWTNEVKTPYNEYMASEWSREAMRQLRSHPSNQKPIKDLPLFNIGLE